MNVQSVALVVLLCVVAGVSAKKDFKNDTIECVFKEYNRCYHDIASLGANFSVRYDETEVQINTTCKSEMAVKQCISGIVSVCNSVSGRAPANRIIDLIHNICNRNKTEHKNFLNSTHCYNINQNRRRHCVNKHSYGSKTDAKSLCCSNKKTLQCLKDDLRNSCAHNYTEFQNHIMETYRSHHSTICGPYYQYCSNALSINGSGTFMAISLFLIILHRQLLIQ
ncbi:uncharacterized protein TNCT_525371 [Trichonephila clavata]|uniref:Uncharacterized protein n=1 Tax=Trichonephila clavata TaxID=2740835 RepID=A0A8X6I9E7_TRICU|nr:uncharacterized protein TNCT_525371 [Trichonephila clavata]